ncbi:unnamed protein product [Protopolystoma xenopodis]|uniref:Uncharacterized protein n=1 Tax=Protopolystoma xenopodis TaxID=117903 RepID=A0A448XCH2_9PLAT|nr:unnamed protein product [Protopolystoma xenopodis]
MSLLPATFSLLKQSSCFKSPARRLPQQGKFSQLETHTRNQCNSTLRPGGIDIERWAVLRMNRQTDKLTDERRTGRTMEQAVGKIVSRPVWTSEDGMAFR